jgi:phosphoesterase RecJ-like protein
MYAITQQFEQIYHSLINAKNVLLVAHQKPDGDTLGSSSAILSWLIIEGKNVTAFCVDEPPHTLRYLDNIHLYSTDHRVFESRYDVVVVFDSGNLRYCGISNHIKNLEDDYLLINIDHHITNENYGHINLVLTDASSTAEVVHRFFDHNKVTIDARMATSLLTGIVTDTGNFSNAATTNGGIDAAAKMLAAGARAEDIINNVQKNKTVNSLKLWGTILSRLTYNPRLDIASTYVLKKDMDDSTDDAMEGFANFLNGVVGQTDAILFLREMPNGFVKGSLRSATRDVSTLAKLLGGGGHKKAAAFTIQGRIAVTDKGPKIVS